MRSTLIYSEKLKKKKTANTKKTKNVQHQMEFKIFMLRSDVQNSINIILFVVHLWEWDEL